MKISRIEDYKGGWYVGDFDPSCHKTSDFEVCFKIHKKGEFWDTHYHKIATEINLLLYGEMTIQNKHLKSGDIFILEPFEISDPIFLTDCQVIVIKTPSLIDDKYIN